LDRGASLAGEGNFFDRNRERPFTWFVSFATGREFSANLYVVLV